MGFKFKEGDEARVIDNVNEHVFEIGETVRIASCVENGDFPYYIASSLVGRGDWAITDEELAEK